MLLKANKTIIYENIVVKAGEIFDMDVNDEGFKFFRDNSSPANKPAQNGSEKAKNNKGNK